MAQDVFRNVVRRPPAPNIQYNTKTDNTNLLKDKDSRNQNITVNDTHDFIPPQAYVSSSTNSAVAVNHKNFYQTKNVTQATITEPYTFNQHDPKALYAINLTQSTFQNSTPANLHQLDKHKHSSNKSPALASTTTPQYAISIPPTFHLLTNTTGLSDQSITIATEIQSPTLINDHHNFNESTMHHYRNDDLQTRYPTNPPPATQHVSHVNTTFHPSSNYTTPQSAINEASPHRPSTRINPTETKQLTRTLNELSITPHPTQPSCTGHSSSIPTDVNTTQRNHPNPPRLFSDKTPQQHPVHTIPPITPFTLGARPKFRSLRRTLPITSSDTMATTNTDVVLDDDEQYDNNSNDEIDIGDVSTSHRVPSQTLSNPSHNKSSQPQQHISHITSMDHQTQQLANSTTTSLFPSLPHISTNDPADTPRRTKKSLPTPPIRRIDYKHTLLAVPETPFNTISLQPTPSTHTISGTHHKPQRTRILTNPAPTSTHEQPMFPNTIHATTQMTPSSFAKYSVDSVTKWIQHHQSSTTTDRNAPNQKQSTQQCHPHNTSAQDYNDQLAPTNISTSLLKKPLSSLSEHTLLQTTTRSLITEEQTSSTASFRQLTHKQTMNDLYELLSANTLNNTQKLNNPSAQVPPITKEDVLQFERYAAAHGSVLDRNLQRAKHNQNKPFWRHIPLDISLSKQALQEEYNKRHLSVSSSTQASHQPSPSIQASPSHWSTPLLTLNKTHQQVSQSKPTTITLQTVCVDLPIEPSDQNTPTVRAQTHKISELPTSRSLHPTKPTTQSSIQRGHSSPSNTLTPATKVLSDFQVQDHTTLDSTLVFSKPPPSNNDLFPP